MRRHIAWLVIVVALPALCDMQYKGITYTDGKYCPNVTFSSPLSDKSLWNLHSTGANSVAVVVTEYMRRFDTTEIFPLYERLHSTYYTYYTATEAELVHVIRKAKELGLHVMLKPHIDLIDDPEHWRGDIGGTFTDAQWEEWFASYGRMMRRYTALAKAEEVDMISISCELIQASKQDRHWRNLISELRGIYGCTYTDSANWGYLDSRGGEETNKTWWDAVDLIGVDAYYPILPKKKDASLHELVEAWQPVVVRMENLTSYWDMPIIFTEIGYCSGDCSRQYRPTHQDFVFQALRYEAAFIAFGGVDWFHGIYWWTWNTDPGYNSEDCCITPQYKPSEDVLRRFYG